MIWHAVAALLALAVPLDARHGGGEQQSAPTGPSPTVAADASQCAGLDDEDDRRASDGRCAGSLTGHAWFVGSLSSAYDTNIDHEAIATGAIGSMARAALGLQSDSDDPLVSVEYELGVYRFTNSRRWNRTIHNFRAELEPPLSGPIRPALAGEIRLGSATEDRELANQYIIEPEVEFRLDRMTRLTAFGAHRKRRFTDRPERNATNRFVGVELLRIASNGVRWYVGGLYEVNDTNRDRSRYNGWTAETTVLVPLTDLSRLRVGWRYRFKRYEMRLVEVNGEEEPRADHRFEPRVSFNLSLGGLAELLLVYKFEFNRSNEPEQAYRAHRAQLTLLRRF